MPSLRLTSPPGSCPLRPSECGFSAVVRDATLATLFVLAPTNALLAQQNEHAEDVDVRGRVVEVGTDRPVPLAWVTVPQAGIRIQADSAGVFLARGVPSDQEVLIRIEQLGYRPRTLRVPSYGRDSEFVVELQPEPVELEGLEVEAERVYNVRELMRRRLRGSDFLATVRGQLDLLSSDAPQMVDYLWEEARALVVPCPGTDQPRSWANCMRLRGRVVPVVFCIDDLRAPGGLEMLYSYKPEDLFRVEVLPYTNPKQVRIYTRPYAARLARTGKAPGLRSCF